MKCAKTAAAVPNENPERIEYASGPRIKPIAPTATHTHRSSSHTNSHTCTEQPKYGIHSIEAILRGIVLDTISTFLYTINVHRYKLRHSQGSCTTKVSDIQTTSVLAETHLRALPLQPGYRSQVSSVFSSRRANYSNTVQGGAVPLPRPNRPGRLWSVCAPSDASLRNAGSRLRCRRPLSAP